MYFVDGVKKNSLAFKAGLIKDDIITHINGLPVTDGLCYGYLLCQERVILTVTSQNIINEIEINNDYEDIGVINDRPLIENPKSCHNKCIFCFIDQLPRGLRETLYFKDDDSRLSFLTGNYVTLTNMSDDEFENIIKMRLSPVNISVHTTNDELRKKMLNNKNAGGILEKIERLIEENITVNCQIVLCKGFNDGYELENSINDLYKAKVNSLSVVPMGFTKFRDNLEKIEPFSKEDCINIIKTIEKFSKMFYNEIGVSFVYPSDEFFLKGELALPKASYYDGFPQIENGVGLLSSPINEFTHSLSKRKAKKLNINKTIATSYAAYDTIKFLADKFNLKYNSNINVIKIKNNFFGEKVTVAGLLTGSDIIEQLKGKSIDYLVVTRDILRSEGDLTLDNMTIKQMETALNCKITLCNNSGKDFINCLLNAKKT